MTEHPKVDPSPIDQTETGPQPVIARPEDLKAVPVRHPWRWVSVAVIAVLAAQFVHWLATAPAWQWKVYWNFLFDPRIIRGIGVTLMLTVIAMVIGIAFGLILAVMRVSTNPILRSVAWLYIWFFRGTPVIVQIIFWYNIPSVLSSISIGIPFGPSWFPHDSRSVITGLVAACLALGLNEAAYMSEIVRAGLISVDEGQIEAASAIGLNRVKTMWRIVIPQAMRVIVPPTGNETISMLKTTALASVIAVTELLYAAQLIYSVNYKTIPLLLVASTWYLVLTSILMTGQYYVERYYAKGSSRQLPMTPIQKIRNLVGIGGTA
jgi:polar amino acid transport system permease protein